MNSKTLFSDRRNFLKALAMVGGSAPFMAFGDEAPKAAKTAKAKSVIQVFLPGGMSAQESFDPKPNSPFEYRGPFGSIKTKLPGVHFSENLVKTSQVADKICVIRSMNHGEADHSRGSHNMYTGYRPSPAIQYPSMGSVCAHELGTRNNIPPYICVPDQPSEYAGTGYLSSTYSPFSLGADPGNNDFKVRDLSLSAAIKPERFATRKNILNIVDSEFKKAAKSDLVNAVDSFYEKAYALMDSLAAREAFDISKEDPKTRDFYGRHAAGQRFLMARRLVEGGARYVTISVGGWDHHNSIKEQITQNLPEVDQAFAALVSDLDRRGRLDDTLVMLTTEFGRTPKINPAGGRDHYPRVFSLALAGGGLKKGCVYGKTDATASAPEEDPVMLEDFARTVHTLMGIDPDHKLMSPGGRPVAIVTGGELLTGIMA